MELVLDQAHPGHLIEETAVERVVHGIKVLEELGKSGLWISAYLDWVGLLGDVPICDYELAGVIDGPSLAGRRVHPVQDTCHPVKLDESNDIRLT